MIGYILAGMALDLTFKAQKAKDMKTRDNELTHRELRAIGSVTRGHSAVCRCKKCVNNRAEKRCK